MSDSYAQRKILTVSELTARIKELLENNFSLVWITGEISNFRMPASGHFYFSLKDEKAQLNAVMFRGQNIQLKFQPKDGMQINAMGRISLYEPRGTYQIILEYLEPSGLGALQAAFEQLKNKLAEEGLFDADSKKPLPFLPNKISLITSPTGAVVHDILNILERRFPNIAIEIIPAKVQGAGAEKEIINAITLLNERNDADVAILARGGGSLEDLMPFNTEGVVRAIHAANVPIISAVGHETDVTLADFAADLRAPTPSAAAEIAVPVKIELLEKISSLRHKLISAFSSLVRFQRTQVSDMTLRLKDPRRKIQDLRLRLDDLNARLMRAIAQDMRFRRERTARRSESLIFHSPLNRVANINVMLKHIIYNLPLSINIYLNNYRSNLDKNISYLRALSPKSILKRGYSITRTLPEERILRDAGTVDAGQKLEILLDRGSLHATVAESVKKERP
ncbi:MAG: exodeoxyribonuclease VII large subunit [Deltaproteobacteria bacterium]